MQNKYDRLSLVPGYDIDPETGEAAKLRLGTEVSLQATTKSKYDRKLTQRGCDLTGEMGEKILTALTGGTRQRKANAKGGDIRLPDGSKMESKTSRNKGVTVIKKGQLEALDENGLYGLVFYKTKHNQLPSEISLQSESMKISLEANLRRNINIQSVFIFPKGDIVHFYNDPHLRENGIKGTNVIYKGIRYNRAYKMFHENPGGYDLYKNTYKYKKHIVEVLSVGYEPQQHRHGLLLPHDFEE